MWQNMVWKILLSCCLLLSAVRADTSCTQEGGECAQLVQVLDDQNFQEVISSAELILVVFHAPWCRHCELTVEPLEGLAREVHGHNILIGKCDTESAPESKTRYAVSQVPDVMLFSEGVYFPYDGPLDLSWPAGVADYLVKLKSSSVLSDLVLVLTEDNFDNIVNAEPLILVDFYAEWCVHCQRLEPHFAAAARRLIRNKPPVRLGKVKVPDEVEVAKRFGIGGYPLLLMFRYGKQYNYTGPREEDGIVEYMIRQAGPSSVLLNSVAEVEKFSSSKDTIRVVGFFTSTTSSKLVNLFVESGNLVRNDMQLGHCTDESIAKSVGFPADSAVVYHPRRLVSRYEPGYAVLQSLPRDSKAMSERYFARGSSLVGQMTKANMLTLHTHRPMLVAYYDISWEHEDIKTTKYWHDVIASVAKDFMSSDLTFAVADEQEFKTDLISLGLSEWGEDVAVGIFAPGPVKYAMREEFSADNVREFAEAFLAESLPPHLSSEAPPRVDNTALIRKIVGSTFEQIVLDPGQSVMVRVCIPAIPACEKSSDWYAKAAARYHGKNGVIFSDFNIALNDLPLGTVIEGDLPAFFYSAKGKTDLVAVSPKPTDDADLVFFLKWRHQTQPLRKDGADWRREAGGKKTDKNKKKGKDSSSSKMDGKKNKKKSKEEL